MQRIDQKIRIEHHTSAAEDKRYGLEYQPLTPKLEPVYKPFHCKDFFNEIFASYYLKKNLEQYGYETNYSSSAKLFGDNKYVHCLLRMRGGHPIKMKEFGEAFLKRIHKLEKLMKFNRSDVKLANDDTALVFYIPVEWTRKPILISLYTLLMRCYPLMSIDLHVNIKNYMELYDGEIFNKKIAEFDVSGDIKSHMSADIYTFRSDNAIHNLRKVLSGDHEENSFSSDIFKCTSSLHNRSGISNFKFKIDE